MDTTSRFVLRHIGTKRYLTLAPRTGWANSDAIQMAWRYPSFEAAEADRRYMREFADTYEVVALQQEHTP